MPTKEAVSYEQVDAFSKFIGRIETEIEIAAHYVFGCAPEQLTVRVSRALGESAAQSQLHVEAVPAVRRKAVRAGKYNLTDEQKQAVIRKRKRTYARTRKAKGTEKGSAQSEQ